ncbi:MAG: ABC transporter permease, partial [Candidatus Promineifilaceae bacterium]
MAVSMESQVQTHSAPAEASLNGVSGIISPKETLRIAWEGVLRNKVRSLLTMLGIIIGVAAVITMISLGQGAQQAVSERLAALGTNLIYINSGEP